jgi:hypothetical protein
MIVRLEVVQQSRLRIGAAVETRLLQQLGDAAVEARDHAIGLRMAWWRQAVFDVGLAAGPVKHMAPAWFLALAIKAVGELRTIVGQDLGDFDETGFIASTQEIENR